MRQENSERDYQSFFESHPIVFQVLGYDVFQSYEKSSIAKIPFDEDKDFTPEPDFLCANLDSCRLTIFELKTPFVKPLVVQRADGKRRKLTAFSESYISQAVEYVESIRGNNKAREIVKSDLSLERISTYCIVVAIGLQKDNDIAEVSRILENRKTSTSFLYYDQLLEKLIQSYSINRKYVKGSKGWTFTYHIVLDREQRFDRSYIADYGSLENNRLSIFIENKNIVCQCIDAAGEFHTLKSPIEFMKAVFLMVEFSTDDYGIYLSLNVDNEEKDLRVGSVKLVLDIELVGSCVGADLTGKNFGRFYLIGKWICNGTLSLKDKLGAYHYFKRTSCVVSDSIFFDGSSCMLLEKTDKKPNEVRKYIPASAPVPACPYGINNDFQFKEKVESLTKSSNSSIKLLVQNE
ncbi:MAG: DUF4263 domain-containing protein [Leptolyngbya sp. SIOISBB]|nr:DUF4263 domain-containing protein [Leptolyngbya sp. SIOISBB]